MVDRTQKHVRARLQKQRPAGDANGVATRLTGRSSDASSAEPEWCSKTPLARLKTVGDCACRQWPAVLVAGRDEYLSATLLLQTDQALATACYRCLLPPQAVTAQAGAVSGRRTPSRTHCRRASRGERLRTRLQTQARSTTADTSLCSLLTAITSMQAPWKHLASSAYCPSTPARSLPLIQVLLPHLRGR